MRRVGQVLERGIVLTMRSTAALFGVEGSIARALSRAERDGRDREL